MRALQEVVQRRTGAGDRQGVTSVCSAHPLVVEAAVAQAVSDDALLLVEATSNQVDQFGGYTGMRPGDFRDLVHRTADRHGLGRERVVLGGDHLGPNTWRDQGAREAMVRAEDLVVAYVRAGFTKIHLDCSMACAGDRALDDAVVAERAARLARAAEDAARHAGLGDRVGYVVGTEVPVPGGAHESIEALTPTSAAAARATLAAHREAFARAGLEAAWGRVMALVVQPGVEFDHARVVDYDRDRTGGLRAVLEEEAGLVFEAHSTDYQVPERLSELVADGWAVLKVGPALTFALREALFALARIEDELVGAEQRSDLAAVVEAEMVADPRWWRGHHHGDEAQQALARRYSYSDRMRYYWPRPAVVAAQERLLANLTRTGVPLTMLSAHLPDQYARVRAGHLAAEPTAIALDRVREVLRAYSRACRTTTGDAPGPPTPGSPA